MHKFKPEMAKKWEKETPKGKKLPERVKKKAQLGANINPYNWMEEEHEENIFLPRPQIQEDFSFVPYTASEPQLRKLSPLEDAMNKGIIQGPEGQTLRHNNQFVPNRDKNKDKKQALDPYFLLRGAKTGMAWLGNQLENKRQNQYMYNQLSTLGQLNAMPANNFQPNPFSLYAKYGGSIKKIIKSVKK